jgi:hypothetical protein
LIELLVDCIVVTDEHVEIRYVIPTTEASSHIRFCHLRKDYFVIVSAGVSTEYLLLDRTQGGLPPVGEVFSDGRRKTKSLEGL